MFKIFTLLLLAQLDCFAMPAWINSPMSFCPPSELCAVGESAGSLGAEAAARNSMAKIFSTRVESSSSVMTTSESTTDKDGVISGDVSEDTFGRIREFTDEVIEGSYIKERFESEDSFYALIALHKRKSASLFEDRMKRIDSEVKSLIADGRRSSLNKALKKLKVRAAIHDRYRILRNLDFPAIVKLSQVLKLKGAKRALGVKVSLNINEITKTKEVLKSVKLNLINNDFIIVKNGADFRVEVNLIQEDQYIKVKGFVKSKFILNAKSFNKSGNEIGALKYEIIQTGRSKEQAYENAVPGINKFIEDKFDELNID